MRTEDDDCGTCMHFQPFGRVLTSNEPNRRKVCLGECRALPPTLAPDHVERIAGVSHLLTGAWPIVTADDFCGAFHACPPEGRP